MRIREAHALPNKPIKVRRRNGVVGVMSPNVSHTKVVRQNDHDVGAFGRHERGVSSHDNRKHQQKKLTHDGDLSQ